MTHITTHVLDTSTGKPAEGVSVRLEKENAGNWTPVAQSATDGQGRIAGFIPDGKTLSPGVYRLIFETEGYFQKKNVSYFYPFVSVVFRINSAEHYHVPLLISPWGYTTYRGG